MKTRARLASQDTLADLGAEAQARHLKTPPQLSVAGGIRPASALLAVDRLLLLAHDVADELVEVVRVLGLGLAAQRCARLAHVKASKLVPFVSSPIINHRALCSLCV